MVIVPLLVLSWSVIVSIASFSERVIEQSGVDDDVGGNENDGKYSWLSK